MSKGIDLNNLYGRHIYPPDGDKWYQKGWVIYLFIVAAVFLWLILKGISSDSPRALPAGDAILHEDELPEY